MIAEEAERVVVASSIADANVYRSVANLIELIYDGQRRRLFRTCAEVDDIGPFRWSLDDVDPVALWPQKVPLSTRVRAAAVALIADVPLIVVEELVDADSRLSVSQKWIDQLHAAARRRATLIDLEKARTRLLAGADAAVVRAELAG